MNINFSNFRSLPEFLWSHPSSQSVKKKLQEKPRAHSALDLCIVNQHAWHFWHHLRRQILSKRISTKFALLTEAGPTSWLPFPQKANMMIIHVAYDNNLPLIFLFIDYISRGDLRRLQRVTWLAMRIKERITEQYRPKKQGSSGISGSSGPRAFESCGSTAFYQPAR